jgi:hypothetical protein
MGNSQYLSDVRGTYTLCENGALADTYALSQQKKEQGRYGHEAESAYLDHDEYDDLPKQRPVSSGVDNHEACDAGGGRGSKERRQEIRRSPALGSNRQSKKTGPDKNYEHKTESDYLAV